MGMEVLLFFGGLVAGIINTLAGNGSALTVGLLLASGYDGAVANATNRIGVLGSVIVSWFSLPKTKRKHYLLKSSKELILPTLLGTLIGGLIGVRMGATAMEWLLAIVMLGMLFSILTKQSRWSGASLLDRPKPRWKSWLYFFLIGFYGGVVQMGIGVLMLIVLVLIDKWSMRDGNVIKIIMANVLSVPAAFIYFSSDLMAWRPGLILAAGGMIGSWVGARYLVRMPRVQPYVRYLLIAVVAFGSVQAIIKALN